MSQPNRFAHFDPAEVLLLQYALVEYKAKLEGENYSIILSRLVDEAHAAPALPEGLPGTRRDFEGVLRGLGVSESEIADTGNWPLADVEALVHEKTAEANEGST
jgi:hypothetical protein